MTDDEISLRRTVAAAERARAFIEDPLLVGAFEALEARFLMAWRATQPTDTDGRETLWHHIQALGELRLELNRTLEDGAMARVALSDLRDGTNRNP
jgi:hypothetical protein